MAMLNFPVGVDSFREMRELGYYYIDKTGFIEKLLQRMPAKVSLITRPRRFGKTLNMSMLEQFFDISNDNAEIFSGLTITKNKEICEKWMHSHPVIFLSLKGIEGETFQSAIKYFMGAISRVCKEYDYLFDSPKVGAYEKELLLMLRTGRADVELLGQSLLVLSEALKNHWGKPAILLIDEYDVPLASAERLGYYDKMILFIRALLGYALKGNASLLFSLVTGCLRISKESIFTGINNLTCYGISHSRFSDCFGFTNDEVMALLEAANLTDKYDIIKKWYDGYRFGESSNIYCPWDVINYIMDLQENPSSEPYSYWRNSSGNDVIRKIINISSGNESENINTLMRGKNITVRVNEEMTYDSLYSAKDNIWSLLYLTGYLTKAGQDEDAVLNRSSASGMTRLKIPNQEIRELFADDIVRWFTDRIPGLNRDAFFRALWSDDAEAFTAELSAILMDVMSYLDYRESYYHGMVAGLFYRQDVRVSSQPEKGLGRPDIVVRTKTGPRRAAVIELKTAKDEEHLLDATEEAHAQILRNRYCDPLVKEGVAVTRWAIAFCRKRCLATCRS